MTERSTRSSRSQHALRSQIEMSKFNHQSRRDILIDIQEFIETAQDDVILNDTLANESQRFDIEKVQISDSNEDLQAKFDRLKKTHDKTKLRRDIEALRADEATSFQNIMILSLRSRDEVESTLNIE